MRRFIQLTMLAVLVTLGAGSFARPAAAHNSLVSSTPADGTSVDSVPTSVSMVFAKPVPLDTMSLEMIEPNGVRHDLADLRHGPSGGTEVLAALPALTPGEIAFRWALVGADGHRLTGRFSFTVSAVAAPLVSEPVVVSGAPPTPSASSASSAISGDDGVEPAGFSEPFVTGDIIRWLMRVASYLAIVLIVGVIATMMFVWSHAWNDAPLRRYVSVALGVVGVLAVAQLLVVGSDISGRPPWAAAGLGGALETDAGRAFGFRAVLSIVVWFVVYRARPVDERRRWIMAAGITVLALATWAFAGHAKSMRWAVIGVPLDIVHFAAAGAWVGGLAIMGFVTLRRANETELVRAVSRFSRMATVSVVLLVGTGVVQSLRLGGSPGRLVGVDHGRWLLAKLVVIAGMLVVANANRKRAAARLRAPRRSGGSDAIAWRSSETFRRSVATECVVGLIVVAISAAMVVSPPATASGGLSGDSSVETSDSLPLTTSPPSDPPALTVASIVAASATTVAPTVCAISTVLTLGASGAEVTCLQQALARVGAYSGVISGDFDAATDAAVRSFQSANALLADGIVGPVTGRALTIWANP